MTIYVVVVERNVTCVNGEMFWIVGVYADRIEARRARWSEMRDQIAQGQSVYGRRTEGDWDVEVKLEEHEVQ